MSTEGVIAIAPSHDPGVATCPMCEPASLQRRRCKSVYGQCGYVESCEDNFVPNEETLDAQGETGDA